MVIKEPKVEKSKIYRYINLSDEEQKHYLTGSNRYNAISMKAVVVLILLIEMFNMYRVVYLSNSGLQTVNNQIYFGMYLALFLSAIIFVVIERLLYSCESLRKILYVIVAFIWVMWHVLLTCYEIIRDSDDNLVMFFIAILGIAIFLQTKPKYTITIILLAYGILLIGTRGSLDHGHLINATICVLVACIMELRSYSFFLNNTIQHLQISVANQELDDKHRELEMNLQKYHLIMNYSNDYIFELDLVHDTILFSANTYIEGENGVKISHASKWIEKQTIVHEDDKASLLHAVDEIKLNHKLDDFTIRVDVEKEGEFSWYRIRVLGQLNEDKKVVLALGMMTNIDAEQKNLKYLELKTRLDPMTGLLNPVAFRESYNEKNALLAPHQSIVMMMIDLDYFKQINDTHGHYSGDIVLKKFAELLRSVFRSSDYIARLGGDEFGVLMYDIEDVSIANMKAEQLLSELAKLDVTDKHIHIGCSIGIYINTGSPLPYREMFNNTDSALYKVKESGRGHYFNSNLDVDEK